MIIEVQAGKNPKKDFKVNLDTCYVGSDSSCEILIKHSSISGKHLKIEQEGYKLYITDISDSNTVFINNYKLEHKEKTIYHGDSSIQLAPGISIRIESHEVKDSHDDEGPPKSSLEQYEQSNPRIKKVPIPGMEKYEKPIEKKQKVLKNNQKNIILFLIIFTISFWLFKEEEAVTEEMAPLENQSSTKKMSKVSLPKTDLDDLFKGQLCVSPQEISLCKLIFENKEPQEGIKITDEGIFIFYKLDAHLIKNNQIKLFQSYSDDKKLKYTLASLVLKGPTLKAISNDIKIHAIGYDISVDIPKMRGYLRIDRSPKFNFSEQDLKVIHSYSLNAGMPKVFEKYLSEFVSFKKL